MSVINIRKFNIPFTIFAFAFILRLFFIFIYSGPLVKDAIEYDYLAKSIIDGKGYVNLEGNVTAIRPPGYPFFLSLIYLTFGRSYLVVRVIQAVMGSILCVLTYYLCMGVFNKKVAVLASFLSAIHLGFIAQAEKLLTEGLATFLVLAAVIFFYKIRKNFYSKYNYFFAGFILGIASLVRPNLLIIFFLAFWALVYDFWKKRMEFKICIFYLSIYVVAFFLPIIPWTVRNYKVFHKIIPISTQGGRTLYISYVPIDGKIYGFVPKAETKGRQARFSSEIEESNFYKNEALKLIRKDPAIFFKLAGLKMMYLFSPFEWGLVGNGVIYNYLFVFCLPFFIISLLLLIGRFAEYVFLFLPVLAIVVTSVVLFGIPRFRLPMEPHVIIFASVMIVKLYEKFIYKKIYIITLLFFFSVNFLLTINSEAAKGLLKIFLEKGGIW